MSKKQDEMTFTVLHERVNITFICFPTCRIGELFCRLVGKDYLTGDQIKMIEQLGFTVVTKHKIKQGDNHE